LSGILTDRFVIASSTLKLIFGDTFLKNGDTNSQIGDTFIINGDTFKSIGVLLNNDDFGLLVKFFNKIICGDTITLNGDTFIINGDTNSQIGDIFRAEFRPI